jgi:hypothetical protein
VLLTDGTTRPIADIQIGDRVVSTEPATGVTMPEPVTDTIIGTGDKQLVDVTVDTDGLAGDATATITATSNHLFWVPDVQQWIGAGSLEAGQWLRTNTGTWVQVTAVRHRSEHATVHNLSVANLHTYYVMAGGTPVLVHNAGCGVTIGLGLSTRGLVMKADNDGAWHLMGLGVNEWEPFLNDAINEVVQHESDITFRFYMDGITAQRLRLPADATLEQRVNAFADLGDTGAIPAALELSLLRKAGLLGSNTVFVEGGIELPNPFAGG